MHDFSKNPFKPLAQMTIEDWQALGFKGGLEIHQQLLTDRKLFCRCPAGRYSTDYDAEVLRHMRPTLSELGEYDRTALMEFKTKKEIIYMLNPETVCTYEMDDSPPFEPDPKAIDIALRIAILLNLNLVDELHIARKQYLDGSIPTGFQRTTILGVDGWIRLLGRRIGIRQLGMEEDSCREIKDQGHTIWFRTDRLGMPLIETVTEPELYTPWEMQQAGEIIREMARSTGLVRTGRGAARQDVNVSIEGGTRVEIKGVDSLKKIPLLTYHEAMRQWNLLRIRDILTQRGLAPDTLQAHSKIVTGILHDTEYLPIRKALDEGKEVMAVQLVSFGGILNEPTQPLVNFAREISDRVRVIACLDSFPNMIHSDSLEPTISHSQWNRIRKRFRGRKEDAFIVVWGSPEDLETASKEIIIRAKEALEGIPPETRQALSHGITGFERILPGADRMYPDTDLPPISITEERKAKAREDLPERPWDLRERYDTLNLPPEVLQKMVRLTWGRTIDEVLKQYPSLDRRFMICRLSQALSYADRKGADTSRLDTQALSMLCEALNKEQLLSDAVGAVLERFLIGPAPSMDEALSPYCIQGNESEQLQVLLDEAMNKQHGLRSKEKQIRIHFLMGTIMSQLLGRVPAKTVLEKLNRVITDGQ